MRDFVKEAQYQKDWRLRNKEWLKKKNKLYRENNKDIIKEKRDKIKNSKYRFGGNKEFVLKRDDYKCTMCGITNKEHISMYKRELSIHHKDGKGRLATTEERNNNINNLTTLCLPCHSKEENRVRRIKRHEDYNKKFIEIGKREAIQEEIDFLKGLLKWDIDKEDTTMDTPIKDRLQKLKLKIIEENKDGKK